MQIAHSNINNGKYREEEKHRAPKIVDSRRMVEDGGPGFGRLRIAVGE
jgi:hypothetical protein